MCNYFIHTSSNKKELVFIIGEYSESLVNPGNIFIISIVSIYSDNVRHIIIV